MLALRRERRGRIETIPSFLEQLFVLRAAHDDRKFWYRGVADANFTLRPTIGRNESYFGQPTSFSFAEEWQLLHRFRRRAHQQFGRVLRAGEALFVARHHGLPTRLLDWTANALYALHFTCCDRPKRAGVLWAMLAREHRAYLDGITLDRITDELELFARLDGHRFKRYPRTHRWEDGKKNRLKLLEAPYNSARLLAQDGIFTVHNRPHIPLERLIGRTFTPDNLDVEAFYSWNVPARCKPLLIRQLNGLGITRRTVYPDVEGIARSLTETELLWSKRPPRPDPKA